MGDELQAAVAVRRPLGILLLVVAGCAEGLAWWGYVYGWTWVVVVGFVGFTLGLATGLPIGEGLQSWASCLFRVGL